MPQERYLFRGSLLNKANTDKDFLLRYAEDELTNGSKDGGDKLPEIRKRAKEAKEAEEEDERMQRNSVIDMTALMKVKNVFKNKICGDIFSSAPKSYDGVLYKSRITTSKETSEAVDTMTMDMDDHDDDSDSLERGSHDSRPMSREAADELMKLGAESSTQAELEGHDIEAVSSDDESEPEEDDEPTLALVGALFAAVADRSCGRRVLVEAKNKVLHGMYTLLRSRTRSTRLTAGLAVCSLLTHGESAPEAVRTGGLNVVKVLAIQGDDDAALASAHALAALGARGDPYEIRRLVNDGVAPVPVHLIMSHGADVATVAVRAITCLAIHEELRAPLVKAGAATALVSVCLRDAATRDELADALARGLLYLASSHDEVPAIVSQRAVTALVILGRHVAGRRRDGRLPELFRDVPRMCVAAIQQFTFCDEVQPEIVGDGGAMLVVEQICGEGVTAAERAPVAPDAAVALANLARTERLGLAPSRHRR